MKNNRIIQEYIFVKLNIAYFRKLSGYTQEQLAAKLGISKNHMSNIESINNKRMPSYELLFDLAKKLKIPVSKLFDTYL